VVTSFLKLCPFISRAQRGEIREKPSFCFAKRKGERSPLSSIIKQKKWEKPEYPPNKVNNLLTANK
jgi:hypothetical protein